MSTKSYYEIEIYSMQNGYMVQAAYRIPKKEGEDSYSTYRNDKFVYTTWAEVMDFVKNNELEVPPKQV